MKASFDQNTAVRTFQEGDRVLAFIPVPGSSLQAKYHGPYEIAKRISDTNYIINTPDRRKPTQLMHVNLIKLYKSRDPAQDSPANNVQPMCIANVINNVISNEQEQPPHEHQDNSNSHILAHLEEYLRPLPSSQAQDVASSSATMRESLATTQGGAP